MREGPTPKGAQGFAHGVFVHAKPLLQKVDNERWRDRNERENKRQKKREKASHGIRAHRTDEPLRIVLAAAFDAD
jgi:hypothetical protein